MARDKTYNGKTTIASLQDADTLSMPPAKGSNVRAFGGAPTIAGGAGWGERIVDVDPNEDVYPKVYGGGKQILRQPNPRRTKGGSGSGAQGAV